MGQSKSKASPNDPNSFSNPEQIKVSHSSLVWMIDFENKIVLGNASYCLSVIDPETTHIIFDTNNLNIKAVYNVNEDPLEFKLGDPVPSFGRPLYINIEKLISQNEFWIEIEYETTAQSAALEWLEKEQTAGKCHPYMFSQCQPINARALLPCQDTPFTKATYTAKVTVPKNLQALMSAVLLEKETIEIGDYKTYAFKQEIPIPSYLIAIAVGKIVGRKIGPRSTVWTEVKNLQASTYEFADIESMIQDAEKLLGEYVWGPYDLLVMPPSFPYGGMENPCLTFVSPTLLAGDRSLVNVVAHEIVHSWTGNLVTNKNWEHFWLNEGFTMCGERKLLNGEAYRQFASIGGYLELEALVHEMKEDNPLTKLVTDLSGLSPEIAYSSIPYQKGYVFLYYLEQKVGGPSIFDPYLRDYIKTFRFKSIDTDDFVKHFKMYFTAIGLSDCIKDIDWDAWLHAPGMPPVKPEYDTSLADVATHLKDRWEQWDLTDPAPFSSTDLDNFFSGQKTLFLTKLLEGNPPMEIKKLQSMQKYYALNEVKNAEIRFAWLRLCIRSRWELQVPLALQFVAEQGRMRYVRPLYRDLYNWKEVRGRSIEHFKKTRSGMMQICANLVTKDLHLD